MTVPLSHLTKSFIADVWQGLKCTSTAISTAGYKEATTEGVL